MSQSTSVTFRPNIKVIFSLLLLCTAYSVSAAPRECKIINNEWAIDCADNEFCMAIDPDGNFYTGSGRSQDMDFKGTLIRPNQAITGKRHWSISCTSKEWCTIVDNEGNMYSGSMRTPDIVYKYTLKPKK